MNGQMSPGHVLPGQMSLWQLKYIQDNRRNLPLKFGQNWVSNNLDIATIEFTVVVVCKAIFMQNPNLCNVKLNYGWVGVLTILCPFGSEMTYFGRSVK